MQEATWLGPWPTYTDLFEWTEKHRQAGAKLERSVFKLDGAKTMCWVTLDDDGIMLDWIPVERTAEKGYRMAGNTRWLLNSAVIPQGCDGLYRYTTIPIQQAIEWLQTSPFTSRIGYPENAEYIRRIAGVDVPLSREPSPMAVGDVGLVIRPEYRQQSGNKRQRLQVSDSDWTFGLLERIE